MVKTQTPTFLYALTHYSLISKNVYKHYNDVTLFSIYFVDVFTYCVILVSS